MEVKQLTGNSNVMTIKANTRTPLISTRPTPEQTAPVQATPPVETSPPEVAPTPKEEVKPDPRFIALSKKEKEILRKQKEMEEREKLLSEKYKPYEELQELSKTNKLKALEKLGMSYDELTNLYLGQNPMTPEQIAEFKANQIVEEKFKEFTTRQQEQQAEQQKHSYTQALAQITQEAEAIASKDDAYPLVKNTKSFDTITSLVEQTYHETGRIMPVEEAMQEVESFLEEKMLEIAKLDKIRSKLLATEEQKPQSPTEKSETPQKPQTLTHKTTVAPAGSKPLTPQEKWQKAIDVFYGRAT